MSKSENSNIVIKLQPRKRPMFPPISPENWEVWRALKKLELLSATPPATLTHLSCSPNFPPTSYFDERTLTHESTVNWRQIHQKGVICKYHFKDHEN